MSESLPRLATLSWVVVLMLILMTPKTARAHDPDNFWNGDEWAAEDRNTTRQRYEFMENFPGGANGNFGDRVAGGAQEWNAVAISGEDNHFVRNGVVADYGFSCDSIPEYKNGIALRDTSTGGAADTRYCDDSRIGTDRIFAFLIRFDPDYDWFKGSNPANIGSGQKDAEAVAAHEFGHVVGGWVTNSAHPDPENPHFIYPRDGVICYSGIDREFAETMCGGSTPPTGFENTWARDLESHDRHTYVDRYEPGG
jgi:hypothetical protein